MKSNIISKKEAELLFQNKGLIYEVSKSEKGKLHFYFVDRQARPDNLTEEDGWYPSVIYLNTFKTFLENTNDLHKNCVYLGE